MLLASVVSCFMGRKMPALSSSADVAGVATKRRLWAYGDYAFTIAAFLGLNATLNLLNKYLLGMYGFR